MDCMADVSPLAATHLKQPDGHRVLVVDDDDDIRQLICDYLTDMGFQTQGAASGAEMWAQLDDRIDLVVLDLMLPGEDGLSLCRTLHHQRGLPVIMISARGMSAERIIGLEIGADDYLCKPFEPRELLARIRAVMRREKKRQATPDAAASHDATEAERWLGQWRLERHVRRLTSPQGHVHDLTRSDFMVLDALSEVPNRIVSRDELSLRAFGREYFVNDRSIDVCISRLRQYFGDNARRPRFIRTVRNEGYLLELGAA